jgi:aspartyl-tRNA(Asn)/glutamyl-tRNA(Gln) amidotransferase subunit A
MCLGALATQTGGSITRPASYCGVYSLKPTHGRVSVDGVLPLAPSLDHIGVMANCVRDLALLFQTIAGIDPYDPASADKPVPDFTWSFPEPPDPQRVALLGGLFHDRAEPAIRDSLAALVQRITGIGGLATTDRHETVPVNVLETSRVALPAEVGEVTARHHTVMAVEAAAYHGPRFVRHPDDYPPKIASLLREGLETPGPDYAACRTHQEQSSRLCDQLFDHFHALLTPATTGAAPSAETTGSPAFNSPWSYTGLPTVSVPFAWAAEGLPLALQLIGRRWSEEELLAIAVDWEVAARFERRPPPL